MNGIYIYDLNELMYNKHLFFMPKFESAYYTQKLIMNLFIQLKESPYFTEYGWMEIISYNTQEVNMNYLQLHK